MDSDSENEMNYYHNDFVNDVCEKCGYETNTLTHYEICDKDTKMIENARKWIRFLDYQDLVIDEYHRLCDEGYILEKNWIVNQLNKFEDWDR